MGDFKTVDDEQMAEFLKLKKLTNKKRFVVKMLQTFYAKDNDYLIEKIDVINTQYRESFIDGDLYEEIDEGDDEDGYFYGLWC